MERDIRSQSVLRQALALAPEERADLVAELLASLEEEPEEDPDEVERDWAAEIGRRIQCAEADGFPGEDWKVVCQESIGRRAQPAPPPLLEPASRRS